MFSGTVNGEFLLPIVVLFGKYLYCEIINNNKSKKRLNECQDQKDSQIVRTSENVTDSVVSVEMNNNFGKEFEREGVENGTKHYIDKMRGILNIGTKFFTWAILSINPTFYENYIDKKIIIHIHVPPMKNDRSSNSASKSTSIISEAKIQVEKTLKSRYEDENLVEQIEHFFKGGFKSAFFALLNSESGEISSKTVWPHYVWELSLPKTQYRNLMRKTFEIDKSIIYEFEESLRKLGLEFVEDLPFGMYIVCFYIYRKYHPETTGDFLRKMLVFAGIEYLKQFKLTTTERREVLEEEVKLIFHRIGGVLWNNGVTNTYNTFFLKSDFKPDELRIVEYLGWFLSIDRKNYQVFHQLIYEFFVVHYLNEEMARKSLENPLNEFMQWENSKINVITSYCNGVYSLKRIYLSPVNKMFTLIFYRINGSFLVDYNIHRDFRDKIAELSQSHFNIDIENEGSTQVPATVPIKFMNDSYVKKLIANQNGEHGISIIYPRMYPRIDDWPEVASSNSYSYFIKINGNLIKYRLNLLPDDVFSLREFISGINRMLRKLRSSSVEFAISEQHLRLVFDDLCFANKVVKIGFGPKISDGGSFNLLEAVYDWRNNFKNCKDCLIKDWLIEINQTVVASTGQEDLNLDNINASGLNDLSIVLKF